MKLPVWLYWEGERPEWISRCEQTVFAHAADVRPLSRAGFEALRTTDLDIDLDPLTCVQRADFARAYLLQQYGGLYLDADCLVMRDLQRWLDWLDHYEFVGYRNRQNKVANAFMAARPGSRIGTEFYRRICKILRSGETLWWDTLGSITLGATVKDLNLPWLEIDCELIEPVCWSLPEAFFATRTEGGHRAAYHPRSFCYMLSKTNVDRFVSQWPKRSLLEPWTFFSYLHQRALNPVAAPPEDPRSEPDPWDLVPFCASVLRDLRPVRVLDASVGCGRWGMAVREILDWEAGRRQREDWQVCLEGIVPEGSIVESYHRQIYNWIHTGSTAAILRETAQPWDLIILSGAGADLAALALDKAAYVLHFTADSGVSPGMEPVFQSAAGAVLLSRDDPRYLSQGRALTGAGK